MRLCFVTSSASRLGYGVFAIIVGTTGALRDMGHEPVVVAGRDAHTEDDRPAWGKVPVESFMQLGARLGFAPRLGGWFERQPPFDIVSLQGVWTAMLADGLRHAKRHRTPCILTPQGMLDPWALRRSRWKKQIARMLYADRILHEVDCFHVNSESELASVRSLGLRAPVAIIPNGTLLPDLESEPTATERPTLLFLGRLHTKKGVRELVSAWNVVGTERPDWLLRIAGPDELGIESELRASARVSNIEFPGAVFGADKERMLREAHAFVLPSFSEGFPMAVLEAWSYRLPVVMTDACNITQGFAREAALRIEPSVDGIIDGLRRLTTASPNELRRMGNNGRELVETEYGWARVARELSAVYGWLRGGSRPANLHTS
jgi:glycosyltransferase involved in cell wall biosynthesis